jgi:hypothetical protein
MNYSAEKVREKVGGSYEKAVEVFAMVSMVYRPVNTAPKKAWERAIKLVAKR